MTERRHCIYDNIWSYIAQAATPQYRPQDCITTWNRSEKIHYLYWRPIPCYISIRITQVGFIDWPMNIYGCIFCRYYLQYILRVQCEAIQSSVYNIGRLICCSLSLNSEGVWGRAFRILDKTFSRLATQQDEKKLYFLYVVSKYISPFVKS